MSHSSSRRDFVIKLAALSAAGSTGLTLSACGGGNPPAAFDYGVASGDPLADRVILWTHARYPDRDDAVILTWEIATDNAFTQIVRQGLTQASASTDFTVKVDATGLSANRVYYYRFRQGRNASPVGRTRTLPTGNVSEVKLAVFSCANYPAGFFNVYAAAARSDAQFAIHLGDYIYEYGATNADGSPAYASANASALGRVSQPSEELTLLSHYRTRHAQYKSDPDSKTLHARMPMIAVWDDHEVANDAYKDGADNHDPATEGSFAARKQAALQAYHEWMPIRTGSDVNVIYRSFQFGQLLSLHMLDTRLIGRDKQVSFAELLNPATQATAQATLTSPTRQMLGSTQMAWLQAQMQASTATWQVLGQQVLMGNMAFPVSVLSTLESGDVNAAAAAVTAYLTAKATPEGSRTPEQNDLLEQPKLGYNLDAWDGYLAARETLLMTAYALGKQLITLAGDTHNAWHSDLKLAGYVNSALTGTQVGAEFATASVSSPGLEEYLAAIPPAQVKLIFENVVDDLKWMDPSRRGYLKMTFTPSTVIGDWVFVDTIGGRSYTVAETVRHTYPALPG
ncbi:MAG: alkaline phosphatase D family protein [Aquabacterium sp.]|jgi:alkaline phosphatase D|uniref:alkaline phosphatase D family protein n=1 Tax=Aquabacterium sp. TaxID=1872578 RepID=UPI001B70FCD7|nr:alkaline phosphatase D family protein [Aquabacterium sp.]MBP7131367.1 alkaline phosphatase D family protein [Aquabacterium sp.]MBP9062223.1 alkaline phosphatase D family protein [Aquabacterium sp.]